MTTDRLATAHAMADLLRDPRSQGSQARCPVEVAVRALDGKWAMLIVRELLTGPRRFGELAAAMPHVSPKTLVERLRYLEGQDVVVRTPRAEWPRRVEYELSPLGTQLEPVIRELWRWGARLQEHRDTER